RRRHTRWPRDWSSDVCSSDLAKSGIDGHAPRRQSIDLAFTQRTKIARSEKHQYLVLVLRRVDRVVNTKTCKAEIAHRAGVDLVRTVVEQVRRELDLVHAFHGYFVDFDGLLEKQALVEKRDLERKPVRAP